MRPVLNQATEDWDTARVTLSGAQGLVCQREASPTAQHDRRGRGCGRCINVVWFDLDLDSWVPVPIVYGLMNLSR